MSLSKKICDAKCCVVSLADAYVKASTFGNNTEAMFEELMLMNNYIKALQRYECNPSKLVHVNTELTFGSSLLTIDNKILSLKSCYVDKNIDPDTVNCLTKDEVCFILEQISLRCESCACGC